jgi:hypothetical protein
VLPTVVVPPPGIEPEPLGLQPSAQTNYARVGYERRVSGPSLRSRKLAHAALGFQVPLRGHLIIIALRLS